MTGRVVLITGGSRGIGLACARAFQQSGDRVVITYANTEPNLADEKTATPLCVKRCDVTSGPDIEALYSSIESTLGPVGVLVCAAGITEDGLLARMSDERWDRVIATDLTGSVRATKRAIGPMMRARLGRVVLISSVVAYMGNPGQTNYAAAKAGLIGFARSLARELASRQITVNVVAPGLVATDMLSALDEGQRSLLEERVPLRRLGSPDEIAASVHFLASDKAAYITGAVLAVDGGLGMGN
jgi:3-oxoacyl-[acyl-carrier protein] reductase